jgi:hypothetical protein
MHRTATIIDLREGAAPALSVSNVLSCLQGCCMFDLSPYRNRYSWVSCYYCRNDRHTIMQRYPRPCAGRGHRICMTRVAWCTDSDVLPNSTSSAAGLWRVKPERAADRDQPACAKVVADALDVSSCSKRPSIHVSSRPRQHDGYAQLVDLFHALHHDENSIHLHG